MKKKTFRLGASGLFLAVFSLLLTGCACRKAPPEDVELTIWGVWDETGVYDSFVRDYRETHPNVKDVVYKKFKYEEYEEELVDALPLPR